MSDPSTLGTSYCLADLFIALMNANKKKYCTVSIEKIRELLLEWYDLAVSEKTVRRHIRKLMDQGLIKRRGRKKKLPNGNIISLPNLYMATRRLFRLIAKWSKRCASFFFSTGRSHMTPLYHPKGDRYSERARYPDPQARAPTKDLQFLLRSFLKPMP